MAASFDRRKTSAIFLTEIRVLFSLFRYKSRIVHLGNYLLSLSFPFLIYVKRLTHINFLLYVRFWWSHFSFQNCNNSHIKEEEKSSTFFFQFETWQKEYLMRTHESTCTQTVKIPSISVRSYLSIYLSIYLSLFISIYLSIYLSI